MSNPTPLRIDQQLDAAIMRVTPRLAEEWLGKNESNRNLRPARVAQLVRDMQAGAFALTGDSIKFDWNGNLIDGQHRLTAVRDSGVTIEILVVRGLAPTVRSVIDTGARRSAGDALRMVGKVNGTRSLAAAIRLLIAIHEGSLTRAGDKARDNTHSEVIAFYDANAELLDYCMVFANRHQKQMHARPAALAAAMFIGAQRDLAAFTSFITSTTDMSFGAEGDPRRTLYRRLSSIKDESHESSEEIYFILRAFGAHLAGERVTHMKSAVKSGRSVIPTFGWAATASPAA